MPTPPLTGPEKALDTLRNKPQGKRTHTNTLLALQTLIERSPERAAEVMAAARPHLQRWSSSQQVLLGRALFPIDDVRPAFIAALGLLPEVVRPTLEAVAAQPGGAAGFGEALARVNELGSTHPMTFVARTSRAALRLVLREPADPTLLHTMLAADITPALYDRTDHNKALRNGWLAAAVAVAYEIKNIPGGKRRPLGDVLDILMAAGQEMDGTAGLEAVQCAMDLGEPDMLIALLDRGARWEGADGHELMMAVLEAHPAWRRAQLGQVAEAREAFPRKLTKL